MSNSTGFTNLVPGFDFLQSLVKNAGAALPGIGQWVAPTLDPAELEKRINELRTVQFWLEQNARMLATTIQALEVQKMTLSTLKTMNVQMSDLRESLKLKLPEAPAPATAPASASPFASPFAAASAPAPPTSAGADKAPPAGVVDPMQWWGALTNQFTQLAAAALKDTAADAAKNVAGNMMKQSIDNATATFKKAAAVPANIASAAAAAAAGAAGFPARAPARPKPARKRSVAKR
jgi:hypothetical protein